jgi:hypothetical protein
MRQLHSSIAGRTEDAARTVVQALPAADARAERERTQGRERAEEGVVGGARLEGAGVEGECVEGGQVGGGEGGGAECVRDAAAVDEARREGDGQGGDALQMAEEARRGRSCPCWR